MSDDRLMLPVGKADFTSIREGGYYYIDKTRIISSLIRDGADSILFTRPRRFGKTLTQTMLASFFDIRRDSASLFEGLDVMDDEKAVEEWMNRYPVIYLTFKDVDGLDFDSAFSMLGRAIIDLFESYGFLQDDEMIGADRQIFRSILSGAASISDIKQSLKVLAKLLRSHYGQKVIILIDEYDVPLDRAEQNGYYRPMLDILKAMFSSVLKDDPDIRKGILTGCLRISKESLFTGLNNLASYSLTGTDYTDSFGFTEEEVERLLRDAGLSGKADTFRRWYDGYRIGDHSIYTPWDVISYARDLLSDRTCSPRNYWADTSGNSVIRRMIDETDASVADEYSTLIAGSTIGKHITENLTYDDLYHDEGNIWSLMVETGYLTLAGPYAENGDTPLRLPNEEMRNLFIENVNRWFSDMVRKADLAPLFRSIWEKDAESLSALLSEYLERSISYYDYSESFYHAFVSGLMSASGYKVLSNRESGTGRPDLIITDVRGRRSAIFEFKVSKSYDRLEEGALDALRQIRENGYGSDLNPGYDVVRFGVAFFKKSAMALADA